MAQAHGDRLTAVDASFLAQEGSDAHMHIGAVTVFEGPAAGVPRLRRPRARAAAPRAALPPEAGGAAARDRAPAVGRRPELQPRVPRAPHGAARAGLRGGPARARGAHPLAAARPHEAAVGAVARAGARGRSLRPDLQDPPRAGGRRRGRGPRDRAAGPRAGAAARPARGRAVDAAARAERRRARRARAARARAHAVRAGRARGFRRGPAARAPCMRRARPPRGSAR